MYAIILDGHRTKNTSAVEMVQTIIAKKMMRLASPCVVKKQNTARNSITSSTRMVACFSIPTIGSIISFYPLAGTKVKCANPCPKVIRPNERALRVADAQLTREKLSA